MCLEIYGLDPANFLSAPGLAWQAASKKVKVKLDLLSDIHMLLMVEKGFKYMKDYDKDKEFYYLNYCDDNILFGWAMYQKLSLGGFKWIEETSQFSEIS